MSTFTDEATLFVALMRAPIGDLMAVAAAALAIYDALERPDERGSAACYAEQLPEFREQLTRAGLL